LHCKFSGDYNSERIFKIGQYLTKLCVQHLGFTFFGPPCIFGKIGRPASEDVVIELFKCKCLPIVLYFTEACKLTKANIHSFDFAVNKFFMKLLKTTN